MRFKEGDPGLKTDSSHSWKSEKYNYLIIAGITNNGTPRFSVQMYSNVSCGSMGRGSGPSKNTWLSPKRASTACGVEVDKPGVLRPLLGNGGVGVPFTHDTDLENRNKMLLGKPTVEFQIL